MEIWKDVVGYEGYYQVSNLGNIRSVDRVIYSDKLHIGTKRKLDGKMLKPYVNAHGYLALTLTKNGKEKSLRVHRLVAEAFIKNPNNYDQINHIDGNKTNNKVENLEWCNNQHNVIHAYKNGLTKHYSKRIKQYDLKGNYIQTFESIAKACEEVNGKNANIIKCAKGYINSAYGYKWRYEEL